MSNLPRDKDITVSSNPSDRYDALRDNNNGWIGSSGDESIAFSGENMSIERVKIDFLTRAELSSQGSGFTTEEQAFLDSFTDQFTPDTYNRRGIIIPLYAYPQTWLTNTIWDKLIDVVKQFPDTAFKIVINPSNGAGTSVNSDFTTLIDRIRATHAEVLGYVATGYGLTAEAVIEADIDNWVSWYDIDGFFFDEVASDWTIHGTTYTNITDYAETALTGSVKVGNCGIVPDSDFFTVFDVVVTWENFTYPTSPELPSGIDYHQKSILYYGKDFNEATLKDSLFPNFGWIYLNTTSSWASVATYNVARACVLLDQYDTEYIQENFHPRLSYGYRNNNSPWYGESVSNEFSLPSTPATQDIALDGYVAVSCYSGSISTPYGTATPGNALFFYVESETVTFTVSADCTYPMVTVTRFAPPYADTTLAERVGDYSISNVSASFKIILSDAGDFFSTYGTDEIVPTYGTSEVAVGDLYDKRLCRFYQDDDNYITLRIRVNSQLFLDGKVGGVSFSEYFTGLIVGENIIVVTPTSVTINGVPNTYSHVVEPVSLNVGYDGTDYYNDQITEVSY